GRGIAIDGALGHRLVTDAFQLLRDAIVVLAWRPGLKRRDLLQQFLLGAGPKGLAPGQEFIEDHAETENVRTAVYPVAFPTCLFRTHVGRRAGILRALAEILFLEGQSEID